jgi:hypothetical protein
MVMVSKMQKPARAGKLRKEADHGSTDTRKPDFHNPVPDRHLGNRAEQ